MIDYETTKSKMEELAFSEPLIDSDLIDQQNLLKRIANLEYELMELSRLLKEHLNAQKPNPYYRTKYRLWPDDT
tara:strand:+ start:1695 stop:1916 length:222 start_codon:yes stop_codon:yes gene_type:complete